MKNVLIAALIFASSPVWAGEMGELWSTTNLSIRETLGFDVKIASIEQKFESIEQFEFAVKSTVYGYDANNKVVPTYKCITGYREVGMGEFELIETYCHAL